MLKAFFITLILLTCVLAAAVARTADEPGRTTGRKSDHRHAKRKSDLCRAKLAAPKPKKKPSFDRKAAAVKWSSTRKNNRSRAGRETYRCP